MKLTFLGTGSMKAIGKRNPMSILIESSNKKILLDCGFGSLVKMTAENINFMKIDAVFISHLHCDHVNDLLPLIHTMAVISDLDSKQKRKQPIDIYGPKNLPQFYKFLRKFQWPDKLENFDINIYPFSDKEVEVGKLQISGLPISHAGGYLKEALAFRLDQNNKSVVYSGDIDWDEKIKDFIDFAKDTDVLIIDGGKPIGKKGGAHLEPFQISQLARDANPRKLVVVHLTDINSPAEVKDAISEFYKGDVIIARDGMELKV